MNKKKLITLMMCLMMTGASAGMLTACGGDDSTDTTSSSVTSDSVDTGATSDSSDENPLVVEYKVKFDSRGGSDVAAQMVKNGAKATKPADPTLEGYTFVEWQLNGNTYDFNSRVTGDITLTAKWEKNAPTKYTVTFVTEGETISTAEVETGKKVMKPADPTRVGYIFDGWMLNGEAYDFNTPVSGALTLTAAWKALPNIAVDFATGSKQEIAIEETTTLTATVDWGEIVWSTSDETIATVENGVVTAVKGGEVTITASVKGIEYVNASVTVTVKTPTLAIDFTAESEDMIAIGETTSLTATTDWKVERVEWSVSDETVATVENGVVTAVKGGEVTVTATLAGVTATKTVYVIGDSLYSEQIGLRINGWDVTGQAAHMTMSTGDNGEMVITAKFQANETYSPAIIMKNMYSKAYYEKLIEMGYVNVSFNLAIGGENAADLADLYVFGKTLDRFPKIGDAYVIDVAIQHIVEYYDTMYTIATSADQVGQATSMRAKLITWKSPVGDWATVRNYEFTISETTFRGAPETVAVEFDTDSKDFIAVGETTKLNVTSDWDTNLVAWSSSDVTKATVENGVVTAVKGGEVTITATIAGVSASKTIYILGDGLYADNIGMRVNGWNMTGNPDHMTMEIGDDGEMVIGAKFTASWDNYYAGLVWDNLQSVDYYQSLVDNGYQYLTFDLKVEGDDKDKVDDLYVFCGQKLTSMEKVGDVYKVKMLVSDIVRVYDRVQAFVPNKEQSGQITSAAGMLLAWRDNRDSDKGQERNYIFTISNAEYIIPTIEMDFAENSADFIKVGETTTLVATTNGNANHVVWTISDETVATFENGVVTAMKSGEVTITATIAGVSASKTVYVFADNGLYDNQVGMRINGWDVTGQAAHMTMSTGDNGEKVITAKFQANETYSPAIIMKNMYSKAYYETLIANGYTKLMFNMTVEGDVSDLYVFGKELSSFTKNADGMYLIVVSLQQIVTHYDTMYKIATSGNQVGEATSISAKVITWKSPAGDWKTVRDYVFTISDAKFTNAALLGNQVSVHAYGWNQSSNVEYYNMTTLTNGDIVVAAKFAGSTNHYPAVTLRNLEEKAYYENLLANGYTKMTFNLAVGGDNATDVSDLYVFGTPLTNFAKNTNGEYQVAIDLQFIVTYYDKVSGIGSKVEAKVGEFEYMFLSWKSKEWVARNYVFTISDATFSHQALYSENVGIRINGWNKSTDSDYIKITTGEDGAMVVGATFQANAEYAPALIVRNLKDKSYYETLIANGYTKFTFKLAVEGDLTDLYVFGKALNTFTEENGVYTITIDTQHFVTYYDTMKTIATSGDSVGKSTSLAAKFITWQSPAADYESVREYTFTISGTEFVKAE